MASTTYGSTPGVQVTVRGAAITGVVVGREQKLVIFGQGDTTAGNASPDDPVEINSGSEADNQFGESSRLSVALRDAIANGANSDDGFLYGVAPTETSVTDEDITSGGDAVDSSSGSQIANAPLVEDTSGITFEDDTGTELDVEFHYETGTDLTSKSPGTDTAFVNKFTGDWVADTSDNYTISYSYLEWQQALDSADGVLNEKESGIYATLCEDVDVTSMLSTKVDNLRDPDFKLVRGIAGAQPNATATGSETNLDDGDAKIDVSTYSDTVDSDAMFLAGPVRKVDKISTVLGAIGGVFAGHDLTDPVYKEPLQGVEVEQRMVKADRSNLKNNHQVIPVQNEGDVRLSSNVSTSTETDWERDFHRRRIVDQMILVAKEIGDTVEGELNNEDTQVDARSAILSEIEGFVADGLLEPSSREETNYFVNVSEPGTDEVALEMGITPEGVVKTVTVDIDVEA